MTPDFETRLADIADLQRRWADGPEIAPTSQAVDDARMILRDLVGPFPRPAIDAMTDGEILLCWRKDGAGVSAGVYGDGTVSWAAVTADCRCIDGADDRPFAEGMPRIKRLLTNLYPDAAAS